VVAPGAVRVDAQQQVGRAASATVGSTEAATAVASVPIARSRIARSSPASTCAGVPPLLCATPRSTLSTWAIAAAPWLSYSWSGMTSGIKVSRARSKDAWILLAPLSASLAEGSPGNASKTGRPTSSWRVRPVVARYAAFAPTITRSGVITR
jgi:hypothetical protein